MIWSFIPSLLNSFGLPNYSSESRKRYTQSLVVAPFYLGDGGEEGGGKWLSCEKGLARGTGEKKENMPSGWWKTDKSREDNKNIEWIICDDIVNITLDVPKTNVSFETYLTKSEAYLNGRWLNESELQQFAFSHES